MTFIKKSEDIKDGEAKLVLENKPDPTHFHQSQEYFGICTPNCKGWIEYPPDLGVSVGEQVQTKDKLS